MNRTMRTIVISVILIALIGFVAVRCSASIANSGQEALNKSIQQAAANGVDYTQVEVTQRDYYNDVSDAKTATVMVYMCGADLESEDGAATADLNEMLHASLGDDVNVIVETGGASAWDNSVISPYTDQLWQLHNDGIQHLADVGLKDMTDPGTLADFIAYCADNYPADRNILILWDHGGGSVGGFGYDENFPSSEAMSISEIGQAASDSGVKFDFIGFDACLMASVEDALVLEPSADYMIASEIPEPGQGWYYKNWLSTLSKDPSTPTEELSQEIVDDFIKYSHDSGYAEAQTLSSVDLTKLPALLKALDAFSTTATGQLANGDYSTLSKAREDCIGRSSSQDYGMVDLANLADAMADGNADSKALVSSIDDAVVYNKTANVEGDPHGITIAFPYSDLSGYPSLSTLYADIGFTKSYAGFLSGFETVRSSGQTSGSLDGTSTDLSSLPWFQNWLSNQYSDNGSYDTDSTLGSELPLTEKDGGYVLHLTDKQWSSIVDIQLSVFLGNGDVYLDLGSDELYSFDDDGDLLIDYDGTWVSLNSTPVEFYADSDVDNGDGTWISTGYVPALVNGKEVQIVLQWDQDHPDGIVSGYRASYDNGVTPKGVTAFKKGDAVEYLYDVYDADGNYQHTDTIDEPVTYDGSFTVSYEDVATTGSEALVTYVLTDVYGNQYLTEAVSFS